MVVQKVKRSSKSSPETIFRGFGLDTHGRHFADKYEYITSSTNSCVGDQRQTREGGVLVYD